MGTLEVIWAIASFSVGGALMARLGYRFGKDEHLGPMDLGISMMAFMASMFVTAAILADAGALTPAWDASCTWLRRFSSSESTVQLSAGLGALLLALAAVITVMFASGYLGWLLQLWGNRRRAASGIAMSGGLGRGRSIARGRR